VYEKTLTSWCFRLEKIEVPIAREVLRGRAGQDRPEKGIKEGTSRGLPIGRTEKRGRGKSILGSNRSPNKNSLGEDGRHRRQRSRLGGGVLKKRKISGAKKSPIEEGRPSPSTRQKDHGGENDGTKSKYLKQTRKHSVSNKGTPR